MNVVETILDVLYPPTCIGCGADGFWLCPSCAVHVPLHTHAYCPRCGTKHEEHLCADAFPFTSLLHVGPYADPLWRKLITLYKYHSATCLGRVYKELLRRWRDAFVDVWPWAGLSSLTVIPVPSTRERVRERGFAHTEALANIVRELLVPWATLASPLKRMQSLFANAQLPTDEHRLANVHDAFVCAESIEMPVLLVDDVFTTGATVSSAAHALIRAGAPDVHVLTMTVGR